VSDNARARRRRAGLPTGEVSTADPVVARVQGDLGGPEAADVRRPATWADLDMILGGASD
jgi:hypothetical protein